MAVTRDPTSGIWYPLTAAECTTLYSGRGIPTPTHGYQCQEAAGNLVDFIGAVPLVKFNAPSYLNAVPGHSRLGIGYIANNDCHFVSPVAAGDVGDISTVSSAVLMFAAAANGLGTAPPTQVKDVINLGSGANARNFRWNATSKYEVAGTGQATGSGTASPGNGVHPILYNVNRGGGLFVAQTDQETISPTYTAPAGGSGYLSIGPDSVGDAGLTVVLVTYMLMWAGVNAEFTAAQRASILDCHLNGPAVTSVTVIPSPASVSSVTAFTATATRADGTTFDCTATAVWTTSNPAVATVVAGVVTPVAAGTVTITATYTSLNATPAPGTSVVTVTTTHWPYTSRLPEFRTSIQRAGFVEVVLTATPATAEWTALNLEVFGRPGRAPSRNRS